jgi:hypothetical protein
MMNKPHFPPPYFPPSRDIRDTLSKSTVASYIPRLEDWQLAITAGAARRSFRLWYIQLAPALTHHILHGPASANRAQLGDAQQLSPLLYAITPRTSLGNGHAVRFDQFLGVALLQTFGRSIGRCNYQWTVEADLIELENAI